MLFQVKKTTNIVEADAVSNDRKDAPSPWLLRNPFHIGFKENGAADLLKGKHEAVQAGADSNVVFEDLDFGDVYNGTSTYEVVNQEKVNIFEAHHDSEPGDGLFWVQSIVYQTITPLIDFV